MTDGKLNVKSMVEGYEPFFNSIAIVPPFSGLRRFAEGRGFKQWTGDDSKALMKVSLNSLRMLEADGFRSICPQSKAISQPLLCEQSTCSSNSVT